MKFKTYFQLVVAVSLLSSAFPSAAFADDTSEEARQINVLQSQSPPQDKDAACAWLKRHGTAKSVPALAALLTDEPLSHSARYALESMPGPEAEQALIAALAQTSGLVKAGIVNSLGVRREPAAVAELAKLLADPDVQVASASAAALGEIAAPDALKALEDRLDTAIGSAQNAVVDGCLRGAHHLLVTGDHPKAFSIYQEIYRRQTKVFFHVAAFRGMVLASDARGVDLIADAIANGPASIQMEAIQMVHEKELPGVTEVVAKLLPKVDALTQVALIGALNQRDDPAAVPEIAALTKNAAPEVRVGALGALGNLGDDKDVPMLVEIAAASGDGQAAARQALTLIHRGTPNQALLKLLPDSKAETQVEIIRALNNRGATEAVPQLLQLAKRADEPVQAAVFSALARLVDQSQLNALVQTVGEMLTDAGRASAADALGLACRHIQNRHGAVDLSAVLEALKNGSTETRVALLPVCSSVADPKVRTALRACVADSNVNVHAAAVRALCHTMDAELVPDVVKTAGQTSDEEFRRLAIESFVRLATQEESITIPNPERVKFFQAIMPVAASTAEKRLALSGLAVVPDNGALKLAQPLLSDGTVSNEAALAVIGICRKLPDAEAAKAALENLISRGTGDPILQEAQAVLKLVDARMNYITAWQITGPYRQAGQNFSNLFDIVFPPETADAQNANWRDISVSDDPKSPWAVDLLAAMGGTQEVAYARTSIHSAGEQPAWLLINSDDGVKVWLNGEVVHANNASRAITSPPDKIKITLKPGWNQLLLKVTQNTQDWGFGARLTDLNGTRLTGLQFIANPARASM